MNLSEICQSTPYISGLVFAAEDFTLDLSITRTPELTELLYARSAIVTAAHAFKLDSAIDLVCTEYKGESGQQKLQNECMQGQGMGFNGKQCIHPAQVETVQSTFGPSADKVEWAVRVCVADEKARKQGRGAWSLDGQMVDKPVVSRARGLLAKAEACGDVADIDGLKEKWKGQEPE